jgi:predicted nuclease of predicted toxin-antitoxin system
VSAVELPRMLLLIDENVPCSVAEFYGTRGHTIHYVRDLFPNSTPDPVIAKIGDRLSAIIVTWDKDFKKLANRIPAGNRERFRRLGRISYQCNEVRGLALTQRWIEMVEFHYAQALKRQDLRMIVQIQDSGFKAW